MYLSFYNLDKKPFQISSDPEFLWLGEKHKEALATLRYGVLDNKGFLLITGDVGTGKTTLINALVSSFNPGEVMHAIVTDPELDRIDFFNIVANAFKIPKKFETKADFLIYFSRFLNYHHNKNKKLVLIIDESQRLSQQLLEEIRLLSNIERKDQKLLNIFFLGQNEFNDLLQKHENRALKQRIAVKYHLEPLSVEETRQYIAHRLKIAGASTTIFSDGALKKIHEFSQGYPRLINVICDHALLTGFVYEKPVIDKKIIDECKKDLGIENDAGTGKRQTDPTDAHRKDPSRRPAIREKKAANLSLTIVLLLLLILTVMVLSYTVESDPSQSLRKEIRHLQQMVEKIERRSIDPGTVPNTPVPERLKTERAPSTGNPANRKALEKTESVKAAPAASPVQRKAVENGKDAESGSSEERLRRFLDETGNPIVLYFHYNSNEISAADYRMLNQFVDRVRAVSGAQIVVTGHTDRSGSDAYNQKLSEFRANIVKGYLVGKGLPPEAIEAEGKGGEQPIAGADSSALQKKNRRVEIFVDLPQG
jgi:general secretion pathway protein A